MWLPLARLRMKSALFFCLVVFNCCPKENVILCVVITPSSLSVLMKRSFVLIWSASPSCSCWASADNPPPPPHPLCQFGFAFIRLTVYQTVLRISPSHLIFSMKDSDEMLLILRFLCLTNVVNNEETCLHLLCFRLTELKTSMICPPAPCKPEFGLWSWADARLSGQLTIAAVVMFGSKTVLTFTHFFFFFASCPQTSMFFFACSRLMQLSKCWNGRGKLPVKDVYTYFKFKGSFKSQCIVVPLRIYK